MTKDKMRAEILKAEPANEIAKRTKASHDDLKKELRAVRRREKLKASSEATPVYALYRLEEGDLMSWRFYTEDDNQCGQLHYGDQLPLRNEVVETDEGNLRIIKIEDGLEITTGDLPIRNEFDPRRIYVTPSSTNVAFQRLDGNRVILWSYKHQSEISISNRVKLERTPRTAARIATKKRKNTQKLTAAYLIAQNPQVGDKELNRLLKEAFPSANIKLDGRHGKHYLSLSRRGHLPVAPDTDPREW